MSVANLGFGSLSHSGIRPWHRSADSGSNRDALSHNRHGLFEITTPAPRHRSETFTTFTPLPPRLKCVRRVHGPPSEVEFTLHAQDRMAAASSATPICYERVSTRPESATQGQIFSIDAKDTVFTPQFTLTATAKLAAKEAG